jgi:hypothetical protein
VNWIDVYNQIISDGWRKQVMAFVKKQPNMPAPDYMHGTYDHTLEWKSGLRLSRDYLDSEVYRIYMLNQWERVDEQEFLQWIRTEYNLV